MGGRLPLRRGVLFGGGHDGGGVPTQGGIRIDARVAAGRDEFEELLACRRFGEAVRGLGDVRAVHRWSNLKGFFLHLLPDFPSGQHGVQGRRKFFEECRLLGTLLLQLDLFPLADDRLGVAQLDPVTEDVRMSAYHLLVYLAGDVVEREFSGLGGHLSMQDDMEKQVPQLLPEVGVILAVDGLQEFADLLDQAVADRAVGLLAIPGAAVRGAQSGGGS